MKVSFVAGFGPIVRDVDASRAFWASGPADRLSQVIRSIRRHRVTTAVALPQALEVSERTVYRDVRDLVLSGVPIEGEVGAGYVQRKGFALPPLIFTQMEIEALVLGTRVAGVI